MHQGRRKGGRRRRVLYNAHHADSSPSTAASRREAAKLREARRPPAAYGVKVKRRIQGRWFSLVPVRQRTLLIGSMIVATMTLMLVVAHYLSVTRDWLIYQEELARPLRLDRPDSFGHWIMCVLLAASSGASLLIYQLRRYRNDDYSGQYRLWRLVLLVLLIASVHSLVGLVSWGGALLDAAFGKRVALTGSDWLRLLVTIGAAILALRLIAEVRRSRWALLGVLTACAFFAIPEAANWNMMQVDSIGRWTLVTAAPLIACTALFLALSGYLRMLYREVQQIENVPIGVRFQELRARVFSRDSEEEADDSEAGERRRWWSRRSDSNEAELEADEEETDEDEEYEEEDDEDYEEEADEELEDQQEDAVNEDDEEELSPRRRRRWFGLRAGKAERNEIDESEEDDQGDFEEAPAPKKKRRWSLRLNPAETQNRVAEDEAAEVESEQTEEPELEAKPKKRFGLSWRKRPKNESSDEREGESSDKGNGAEPETSAKQPVDDDDEYIDAEDIDWDSLNKAERRRLRKKLKRQQRAA